MACAQLGERDCYLAALTSPTVEEDHAPFVEICSGLFNANGDGEYSFPSDKLCQLASKLYTFAYGTGATVELSLDLLAFATLLVIGYKPSTERRVGASGDTEHVTMPDFDVTRGDIAKALNWMAHPDFCPSQ